MDNFWGNAGGFLADEEDAEEESDYGTDFAAGRDGVIFLIDCSKGMIGSNQDADSSHTVISLKCAKTVLMNKAIGSYRDMVGIVLFGTSQSKNDQQSDGIYVYQDIDMPNAERIIELEETIDECLNSFSQIYNPTKRAIHLAARQLSHWLMHCGSVKIGHKRVLIFTDNDDPHASSNEMKRKAVRRAKDVADLGINIDLMHLIPNGKSAFDVSRFYEDVVNVDEDEDTALADPSEKFNELMSRVLAKDHKKRPLSRIPLVLGPGVRLSVGVYILCRSATKGSYVHVDSRSNEEIKCVTKNICEDTGQELLPTDIKYHQTFGGSKITFEQEEVASIKKFTEPGLHIRGFQPKQSLKTNIHIKPGHFIYPDNKLIEGSQCLFSALLKRCLARELIISCVYVPSKSSSPRLAALVPQEEELDEHKVQLTPPGFHVVFLPYSDDIRKLNFPSAPKANAEQIDAAKAIVEKLKFQFSPDMIENPTIQKFYRSLEALALDRDDIEDFVDHTLPQTDRIDTKIKNESINFTQLVYPIGYDPETSSKKRKAGPSSSASKPKQVKVVADVSSGEMKTLASQQKLNKLTVPVLKQFCDSNDLHPVSKKKSDLIAAIEMHFL